MPHEYRGITGWIPQTSVTYKTRVSGLREMYSEYRCAAITDMPPVTAGTIINGYTVYPTPEIRVTSDGTSVANVIAFGLDASALHRVESKLIKETTGTISGGTVQIKYLANFLTITDAQASNAVSAPTSGAWQMGVEVVFAQGESITGWTPVQQSKYISNFNATNYGDYSEVSATYETQVSGFTKI
jgi:hypothetical protein